MDFHSLTRKELQTLCKRNKIPANITNVAMADALKALEIVEGLDEFMNQSQSPEKTMNKSLQEIPFTVIRTSTRRKTTIEEPQSTLQPTTRTRRMTRRTMELDEANKNVNVPETPVMATTSRVRAQKTDPEVEEQKKSDLLEIPALQSGRRRPGVESTRRKVEAQKEEGSVQQGYGTRRSVRLLEKCMAGLSLKESEKMEPVKIDEMVEGEVENKNGQSEVPLARNLSASLEDERDLKDVLESSKCHNGENDCTVISEADSHKSDNLDSLSALDTKDASPNEKTDELEGGDKLADFPDGIIDLKDGGCRSAGSDDVAVSKDSYEIVNLNEELIADATKSIDVLVANASEDIPEDVLDQSSSAEFMEPIEAVTVEEYANHATQEIECQKLVGKDCDINVVMLDHCVNVDLVKLPDAEEYDKGKVSQNVSVLSEGLMDYLEKMGNAEPEDDPDQIVTGSKLVNSFLGDSDIDDDTGSDNSSLADELQEEVSCEQKGISIATAPYCSEGPTTNTVDEEVLVDVTVAEAEIIHVVSESSFHNAPQSVMAEMIRVHKMVHGDSESEALVDVCVKPAEEFADTAQEIPPGGKSPTAAKLRSPCPSLISNNAIKTSIPLTVQTSQPTLFTTGKSSSKKQTTMPKVMQVSDNSNKENIDNNSATKEGEPRLGKVKKNNTLDEETMKNLEGMSLRNLKKLAKMFDKLQITETTKNQDKNDK